MYRGGADTLSFTSGGTKILDVDTSGINVTGGIEQAGTSDKNYFAGKIGIGGTNAISTNPQWDLVVGSNNSVGTNGQIFVDATVDGTGD